MGIIFDIDDTLINHTQAEIDAGISFGQFFSEQIPGYSAESFSDVWQRASKKHIKAFLEGKSTFEEQRINRIKDIFQSPQMIDEDAKELFNKYLQLYERAWSLYPDVISFLEQCKNREIPLGIISDGSQEQQEKKLSDTGIRDYFHFVITAESEGMKKPDPMFFQRGKELLSSDNGRVYYIGDNLIKDAKGAVDAGLSGIWLNRKNTEGEFYFTIESLHELSLDTLF